MMNQCFVKGNIPLLSYNPQPLQYIQMDGQGHVNIAL